MVSLDEEEDKFYIQPPVSVLLYLMLFYILHGLVLFRKGDFRCIKCLKGDFKRQNFGWCTKFSPRSLLKRYYHTI